MKTITPLPSSEQSAQLATFVDFFVKEFMAEIWYLEESARGNIPGREEASIGTLFNVACGLASLVPVPGSVIALVASQKLIKASLKLASGIADAVRESEWGSQALAVAEVVKSTWDGYGEQTDDIALIRGEDAESAGLEEGKAVDTESLSVLARWLGHQLAQRYEQALTERLSTEPEAAIMGLARVGARRSLAFLTATGGMTGSPEERTERLLAGVVQGKPMSWYERPLKWFSKGERLTGRDDLAKEKFTAEALYANGIWHRLTEEGYKCSTHSRSDWFKAKICGGQPRYGYVQGQIEALALTPFEGDTPEYAEWLQRRVAQPVTREMIEYYLASGEMDIAREANISAPQTLNAFLAENFDEFPSHGQAVFHGDLTGLNLSSGNFSGSDLSGCQIDGDLSYCRFDDARLYATQWHAVTSKPDSQVSFARAQLGFADMVKARFAGDVDVTQADLTCVNLAGACFGALQQVGTKWYKANLTGVDYEGITKAQREQLALVTAEQAAQAERFTALNAKVAALEAQIKPLLDSLAAKQPVGAGAGAGVHLSDAQRQAAEQRQVLEELLASQEKRLQFEAYCEEKLAQLSEASATHTTQIAALEANLSRAKAASAEGQTVLQRQVDQLSERVDHVERSQQRIARRTSVVESDLKAHAKQLEDLRELVEQQGQLSLTADMTPAEREAWFERSAIQKLLLQYAKDLSLKQQDLHYYVRPDVVNELPEGLSVGDYMEQVETGKRESQTQQLLAEVDDYLASEDKLLLLLGEPGAGKSLFAWYSTQTRLHHYQQVLQQQTPAETPWLPVVIDLKNYRLSELKALLPEYLKTVCELAKAEMQAVQNDRKPQHKLLVVLDGFDELKQPGAGEADISKLFADCFTTCGAGKWFEGQVKLIVTCRVRHLPDRYLEKQYFGVGEGQAYRRRILLPFSSDKIADYLAERAGHGDSADMPSVEDYQLVLQQSASVKEMVRNPFVLRLFVEALPSIQKSGMRLQAITRYDIYQGFVTQWFERNVKKLDEATQRALGVDTIGPQKVVESFGHYAGILAVEMYRHNSLVVGLGDIRTDHEAFKVWSGLQKTVIANIKATVREELTAKFESLDEFDKEDLADQGVTTADAYVDLHFAAACKEKRQHDRSGLKAFKKTSPLRQAGEHYSFIHKSFYEYFIAQAIIQIASADKPLPERVTASLSALGSVPGFESRRLWQEPEAIDFICEYWQKASQADIGRIKATWFAIIQATKGHPEHGVAGANAATLLNWVNVGFTSQDWQGVHLPGADFRHATISGSDLRDADLTGAWLSKLQANQVDLRGANLTDVKFSERPAVKLDDGAKVVAINPKQPIALIAHKDKVRQYHFGDSRWIGEPLAGYEGKRQGFSYSPDGQWLVTSWDKIRQFNTTTGAERGEAIAPRNGASNVCYSPDGNWLVGVTGSQVRQWHAETGQPRRVEVRWSRKGKFSRVKEWHPVSANEKGGSEIVCGIDSITTMAYGTDGRLLAMSLENGMISQCDMDTRKQEGRVVLVDYTETECPACFSPDGAWVASVDEGSNIRQWHTVTGEQREVILSGHTECVDSIAYSPNGRWLAAVGDDSTILQWDVETGAPRGVPIVANTGIVRKLCYSADGCWLASLGEDHQIHQWGAETGAERGEALSGFEGLSNPLVYSPDGHWLASGSSDGCVWQWDAATGEQRGEPLKLKDNQVTQIIYSQDGCWLASGTSDGWIFQWDAATGELRCQEMLLYRSIMSLTYSPDGSFLTASRMGIIFQQWDALKGVRATRKIASLDSSKTSVSYSPDGNWLVSSNKDGRIQQWHAATGRPRIVPLVGCVGEAKLVSYSPDGCWILSMGPDSTIRQWHAETGQQRGVPLVERGKTPSVVYSPDGRWLTTCGEDRTIRQWDAATIEPHGVALTGHTEKIVKLCYSSDGQWLISVGEDHTIRQWRAATDEQRGAKFWGHNSEVFAGCFSHDERWVTTGDIDGKIRQWDVVTGRARGVFLDLGPDEIYHLAYSPDGRWLASYSEGSKGVQQWDAATGEPRDGSMGALPKKGISGLIYSPDGAWLAIAVDDKTIRQCHVTTGEQRGAPLSCGISWAPINLVYSSDGDWLAAIGNDHKIYQWHASTGILRGEPFAGHTKSISCIDFSPQGRWLASAASDKTIRQWDAATGKLRCEVKTVAESACYVSYSSDGCWLFSGGQNGVQQWNAATGEPHGVLQSSPPGALYFHRYSADWRCLVNVARDGSVQLWRREARVIDHSTEYAATPELNESSEQAHHESWQLVWGAKSLQMQLHADSMQLAGAIGLAPHQFELLRQHGYQGRINTETGQIEDGDFAVAPVVAEDTGAAGAEEYKAHDAATPATEGAPSTPAPAPVELSAAGAGVDAGDAPSSPVRDAVAAVARRSSELLLSLAKIIKKARIFSPSHKLRDKLVPIYTDPANVDNTYVSEESLRSAELALREKQICKFARVNLNAACQSSSAVQVKDALDLFEAVVGKEQATVHDKVARVVGPKKQAKYYDCLLFGRARLAELSPEGDSGGASASAALPST